MIADQTVKSDHRSIYRSDALASSLDHRPMSAQQMNFFVSFGVFGYLRFFMMSMVKSAFMTGLPVCSSTDHRFD